MKPQNECEFKMPDIPLLSQLNSKPEISLKTQQDQRLSELKKNKKKTHKGSTDEGKQQYEWKQRVKKRK